MKGFNKYHLLILSCFSFGGAIAGPLSAAPPTSPPAQSLGIVADGWNYQTENKTSVFEGNVSFTTNAFHILADKIVTQLDEGNRMLTLRSQGSPVKIAHKDSHLNNIEAQASKLDYSREDNLIKMQGKVHLTSAATDGSISEVNAESVEIKLSNNQVEQLIALGGGNKVIFNHKTLDPINAYAEADKIEYNAAESTVTFFNTLFRQNNDQFSAKLLTYNTKTKTFSAPQQPGSQISITKEIEP